MSEIFITVHAKKKLLQLFTSNCAQYICTLHNAHARCTIHACTLHNTHAHCTMHMNAMLILQCYFKIKNEIFFKHYILVNVFAPKQNIFTHINAGIFFCIWFWNEVSYSFCLWTYVWCFLIENVQLCYIGQSILCIHLRPGDFNYKLIYINYIHKY